MHAPRTRRPLLAGLLAVAMLVPAAALTTSAVGAEPEPRTYVVRTGDTLSEIAARHGTTTSRLAGVNGISDPNDIRTGRRLVIPATGGAAAARQVHVVQPGESFWAIAHEHGVSIAALAAANRRSSTSVLHPGDRLSVPSGRPDTGGVPVGLLRSGRISLRPTFVTWASRNGIDPALLQAVCYLESGWQSHVVSSTGAVGVCQLMPAAIDFAERLIGTDLDPRDPADNIRMGARTLRWLLVQTGGNTRQALAAYYQGLTALRRSGPYPETVQYVNAVQALAERF